MQRTIQLKAGIPTSIEVRGRQFLALSWSVSTRTTFTIYQGSVIVQEFDTTRRFEVTLPEEFGRVVVTAAADTVLEFIISDGSVRFDYADGIAVNATIVGQPIAVVPDRGAPGNPVYVSGITYSDAPATVGEGFPQANLTSALATIWGANSTARSLRMTNFGPDPCAIGPNADLTWGTRCIVLDVGDTWVETRAPNLQWYGICDEGKTARLGKQRIRG